MNQATEHDGAARSAAVKVDLGGVPETMLWTLHNRAREAKRPDARLKDPDAVRIYDSIAYDYEKSFGKPEGSHPMRSVVFALVETWKRHHTGKCLYTRPEVQSAIPNIFLNLC